MDSEPIELMVLNPAWFSDHKAVREFFEGSRFDVICAALSAAAWPERGQGVWLDPEDLSEARQLTRPITDDLSVLGGLVNGDGPLTICRSRRALPGDWPDAKSLRHLRRVVYGVHHDASEGWKSAVEEVFRELLELHDEIAELQACTGREQTSPQPHLASKETGANEPAGPGPAAAAPDKGLLKSLSDAELERVLKFDRERWEGILNEPADRFPVWRWVHLALTLHESGFAPLSDTILQAIGGGPERPHLRSPEAAADKANAALPAKHPRGDLMEAYRSLTDDPEGQDPAYDLWTAEPLQQLLAQDCTEAEPEDAPIEKATGMPESADTSDWCYLAQELMEIECGDVAELILTAISTSDPSITQHIGEQVSPDRLQEAMRGLAKSCKHTTCFQELFTPLLLAALDYSIKEQLAGAGKPEARD